LSLVRLPGDNLRHLGIGPAPFCRPFSQMFHSVQVLSDEENGQTVRHERCTKTSVRRFQQAQRGRGFTLIELMVVVAIVGIIASLAVLYFGGAQKKITAKSEVTAMFAEFHMRQAGFQLENGRYQSSSATNDETDPWPATPGSNGGRIALLPMPAEWTALNMVPDASSVYCSYVSIVGEGGDDTNVGNIADTEFSYVPPATDWYYLLAQCDMDQNAGAGSDSFYFQHSESSDLFFIRQGQ